MSGLDAAIAIPCVTPNALVARCVSECRAKCPGAEIYVLTDEAGNGISESDIFLLVTGPITMATKRNLVAQRSTRRYLALIDSDAYPDDGWLQNAIAVLEQKPDVFIVGGPNISPPGQAASRRYVGAAQRSFLLTGAYSFRKWRSQARDVDDLPSCNMVLRREDYLTVGGMDDHLYIYEDKELCAKIIAAGKRIHFTPLVTVFHQDRTLEGLAIQRLVWGAGVWRGIAQSKFRLYLLLPTLAVSFFLTFPMVALIPKWSYVYGSILVLYVGLIGMEACRHASRVRDILGISLALVVGNLAPGIGSLLVIVRLLPSLQRIYRN